MGHKTNPISLRLGEMKYWKSRWFNDRKKYKEFLEEDYELVEFLNKKLKRIGLEKVEIERLANLLKIIIYTSRPGLLIGRGGVGIESLKKNIENYLVKIQRKKKTKIEKTKIDLEIKEIKNPESSAQIVANNIADQLEKRIAFRRVIKNTLKRVMQNKEVKGAKILVSGRLNGAEIARSEWVAKGTVPLHTIRANIDYGTATAFATYGTVGIKVWINKGEVFKENKS